MSIYDAVIEKKRVRSPALTLSLSLCYTAARISLTIRDYIYIGIYSQPDASSNASGFALSRSNEDQLFRSQGRRGESPIAIAYLCPLDFPFLPLVYTTLCVLVYLSHFFFFLLYSRDQLRVYMGITHFPEHARGCTFYLRG